jgi:ferritin
MTMTQLISNELNSALCEQIGHEKYNSSLYLYIAGFLKNKGFNNLGSHFEGQHEEEFKHSKMIYDLLVDLNAPIYIPEINEVNLNFRTIIDIATAYLDREILTTKSLDEIKKLAIEEECPVVEEYMRKMIVLQQNEYAEATDFQDKANLTGGDWKFVLLWDLGVK